MAEDEVTYELIRADVYPLLATGANDPAGSWSTMVHPQSLAVDPTVEEGDEVTIRGGGTLVDMMKEPDAVTGGTLTLVNCHIEPEAFETMCGGEVKYDIGSPTDVVGYSDPFMADKPPKFRMRVYAERVKNSTFMGYVKASFYQCTAVPPSYTLDQQTFSVPEIAIKCVENANATGGAKPWRQVEDVDNLGD